MRTLDCDMWDLVPWPGIIPGPPALGVWSLSQWTTSQVPALHFLVNALMAKKKKKKIQGIVGVLFMECVLLVSQGCHRKVSYTGTLNQQKLIFSQSWRQNPGWKYRQGWFLLRSLSLSCRWPSSSLSSPPSVCVLISTYKDSSHMRLGPTHRTSVYLNCLFF